MKCARCGGPTRVIETRVNEADLTTRRRRECGTARCRHRSWTIEVHMAAAGQIRAQARKHADTLRKRWALRRRDAAIAAALHGGWRPLAEQYGLKKTTVYLAARRGRHTRAAAA